jgi:hypothetical protein
VGYHQHYAKLFEQLQRTYGALDGETIAGIIGFSAGGPVSMCERKAARLFVTCELSVYDEQMRSTDGIKFELFCKDDFDEEEARAILTGLGRLSMQAQLGDNHTVDLTPIENARTKTVRLELYSKVTIEGTQYGLYRIYCV